MFARAQHGLPVGGQAFQRLLKKIQHDRVAKKIANGCCADARRAGTSNRAPGALASDGAAGVSSPKRPLLSRAACTLKRNRSTSLSESSSRIQTAAIPFDFCLSKYRAMTVVLPKPAGAQNSTRVTFCA